MHFYYFSERLVTKLSVSSATYVTWQTAILKEAVVLRLTLFACAMVLFISRKISQKQVQPTSVKMKNFGPTGLASKKPFSYLEASALHRALDTK